MNISKDELLSAAAQTGVEAAQAEAIWNNLQEAALHSEKARFTASHVLYYLGALIVIGAMGWFMTTAWDEIKGPGIFAIATAYLVIFLIAGNFLWRKPALKIPAGLLLTIAVCMIPLATYGIERWTGLWPDQDPGSYTKFHPYINGSWIIMEAATVLGGLLVLRAWKFPFLTAPIAYALWFMSMDLVALMIRDDYRDREYATMIFGLIMLLITYAADLRSRLVDFSFWGYLFGLMAFWGGLTSLDSGGELSKFMYCLINLFLIFLSLALRRRAFLIFGALGVFIYLYHLADWVFKNSLLFPFVLSFFGLAIIYLGIQYQKNYKQIRKWFNETILPYIRRLIPPRALVD